MRDLARFLVFEERHQRSGLVKILYNTMCYAIARVGEEKKIMQYDSNLENYLQTSEIIDWDNPRILDLAKTIAAECDTPEAIAKACFEWVRDRVHHSSDYRMNPVTCRASEVLQCRTGYCYAKSHLLAALLRANGIPAGFCYQRLSVHDDGEPYSLHGLNAVHLPQVGWYRIDPRGNRAGINAQFTPPLEQLAYQPQLSGEEDSQTVFPEPLPIVIEALQAYPTWDSLLLNLPDTLLNAFEDYNTMDRDIPAKP
nr:transglutaminase family protein [Lusitaniella coriacea]